MIINLRISARASLVQRTTSATIETGGPVSEWGSEPRFVENPPFSDGDDEFELSTRGRSGESVGTYIEDE